MLKSSLLPGRRLPNHAVFPVWHRNRDEGESVQDHVKPQSTPAV